MMSTGPVDLKLIELKEFMIDDRYGVFDYPCPDDVRSMWVQIRSTWADGTQLLHAHERMFDRRSIKSFRKCLRDLTADFADEFSEYVPGLVASELLLEMFMKFDVRPIASEADGESAS